MAQQVNLLLEADKQAQAAYKFASRLLPPNSKNKSTKIQRNIFSAREIARQALKFAREADIKAMKPWRDVMNLDNSDADFFLLENATSRAEKKAQQAKMHWRCFIHILTPRNLDLRLRQTLRTTTLIQSDHEYQIER